MEGVKKSRGLDPRVKLVGGYAGKMWLRSPEVRGTDGIKFERIKKSEFCRRGEGAVRES